MSNIARVAGQAANTTVKPLDIDDVFSTYLYDGDATTRNIVNGVDLAGEGGLVWIKTRNAANGHFLFDTERGVQKYLQSNTNGAEGTLTNALSAFNSDGFQTMIGLNNTGDSQASWTFRKAPKFFDVVTYTGNGSGPPATQTISHNLGSVPGMIIVKMASGSENWAVFHQSQTNSSRLNQTGGFDQAQYFDSSAITDTTFKVKGDYAVNQSGQTYVAYLFAHNDGDGEFGPDGSDIIKCGSYTGNGSSTGPEIDLGFEPQWILAKGATVADHWFMYDTMRGFPTSGALELRPNEADAEAARSYMAPTSTGFKLIDSNGQANASGQTYIYIAIRRGPLAAPKDATEVFAIDTAGGTSPTPPTFTSGFPVDFSFYKNKTDGSNNWGSQNRLTGYGDLAFNTTSAEFSNNGSYWQKDYMNGIGSNTGTNSNGYQWMFKRAPGFFDVVAYTGTGSNRTVSHNLGVVPEMMWVKKRSSTEYFQVYNKDLAATEYIELRQYGKTSSNGALRWNSTRPTDSVLSVGTHGSVNGSGDTYIAYLFASCPGVSKVGNYTGNGTSQTIDCGFTSGARFVLIKSADDVSVWLVYDTERGITTGNDPFLQLNSTAAQSSFQNLIEPDSSGFKVKTADDSINISGSTYIFYAIA